MPDKFRSTFPVLITFFEGEIPTDSKLSAISRQAKQGLSLVEYAIGDLWNQSGDTFFYGDETAELMIPNIGRTIGQSNKLSPRIPNLDMTIPGDPSPGTDQLYYIYTIPDEDVGNYETRLPFPPHASSTYTWDGITTRDSTPKASKDLVVSSSDWWVDTETGEIFAYDVFTSNEALIYLPGYTDTSGSAKYGIVGDISEDASFNIVPDLRSDPDYGFAGLKITEEDPLTYLYTIWLPPRMPLDTDGTYLYNISPEKSGTTALERNISSVASPSSPFYYWWRSDTEQAPITTATGDYHYRYLIPKSIREGTNWAAGVTLPAGFFYLWDQNYTGTIIEGLTFKALSSFGGSDNKHFYSLSVQGANLKTWLDNYGSSVYTAGRLASSTHTKDDYPDLGLKLICCGTDITTSISELLKQFLNHNHSEQGSFPGRRVSHSRLSGLFDPDPTTAPQLDASALPSDDHPQYLHRKNEAGRDKYKGGMLSDLLMCSTGSTSNYQNITSDSNKIYFGDTSTGTQLYWNYSDNAITIKNPFVRTGSLMNYYDFRKCIIGDSSDDHLIIYTGYQKDDTPAGVPADKSENNRIYSTGVADGLIIDSDEELTIEAEKDIYIGSNKNTYNDYSEQSVDRSIYIGDKDNSSLYCGVNIEAGGTAVQNSNYIFSVDSEWGATITTGYILSLLATGTDAKVLIKSGTITPNEFFTTNDIAIAAQNVVYIDSKNDIYIEAGMDGAADGNLLLYAYGVDGDIALNATRSIQDIATSFISTETTNYGILLKAGNPGDFYYGSYETSKDVSIAAENQIFSYSIDKTYIRTKSGDIIIQTGMGDTGISTEKHIYLQAGLIENDLSPTRDQFAVKDSDVYIRAADNIDLQTYGQNTSGTSDIKLIAYDHAVITADDTIYIGNRESQTTNLIEVKAEDISIESTSGSIDITSADSVTITSSNILIDGSLRTSSSLTKWVTLPMLNLQVQDSYINATVPYSGQYYTGISIRASRSSGDQIISCTFPMLPTGVGIDNIKLFYSASEPSYINTFNIYLYRLTIPTTNTNFSGGSFTQSSILVSTPTSLTKDTSGQIIIDEIACNSSYTIDPALHMLSMTFNLNFSSWTYPYTDDSIIYIHPYIQAQIIYNNITPFETF